MKRRSEAANETAVQKRCRKSLDDAGFFVSPDTKLCSESLTVFTRVSPDCPPFCLWHHHHHHHQSMVVVSVGSSCVWKVESVILKPNNLGSSCWSPEQSSSDLWPPRHEGNIWVYRQETETELKSRSHGTRFWTKKQLLRIFNCWKCEFAAFCYFNFSNRKCHIFQTSTSMRRFEQFF